LGPEGGTSEWTASHPRVTDRCASDSFLRDMPSIDIDIDAARRRVAPHLPPSPLVAAPAIAEWAGHEGRCVLKCENLQPTGSFKVRGALNKVLSLSSAERDRGLVTASTGNHGRAVAHALSIVGGRGTVYIPTVTPPNKVAALRASGIEVCVHGDDSAVSEAFARQVAAETGRVFISPYNDADVVAGQGTTGAEILEQCPEVDAVVVAVGGGGLVAGIGSALRGGARRVSIVGCWPENSRAMLESMRAGHVVEAPELPTLSDGTAGGVEPGSITLELCTALIDETLVVSETEIAEGVRITAERAHLVVEGAAGVAVAAYRRLAERFAGKTVVVVLCGGNIATATLQRIVGSR
jgi:threonine dehydratase